MAIHTAQPEWTMANIQGAFSPWEVSSTVKEVWNWQGIIIGERRHWHKWRLQKMFKSNILLMHLDAIVMILKVKRFVSFWIITSMSRVTESMTLMALCAEHQILEPIVIILLTGWSVVPTDKVLAPTLSQSPPKSKLVQWECGSSVPSWTLFGVPHSKLLDVLRNQQLESTS